MYKTATLDNGMRIVTNEMQDRYSASAGIWVKNGSCHEEEPFFGASHYLEHMLFKGTKKRTALQIADDIEYKGGNINAFTSKENTCFYVKCLGEDIESALDVLADIYCNSLIDEEEFEKEKGVILEEINMYEDEPEDMAADRFVQTLWKGHRYGRPVIGTSASVSALKANELRDFYRRVYLPQNTVLSVAGNINHNRIVELAETYFSGFNACGSQKVIEEAQTSSGITYKYKDTEQMHICLGFPAFKQFDDNYYPLIILNTILGGGAGSRLFQEAREKRGLTYSVYSYNSAYTKAGYWAAASSTAPDKMPQLSKVMLDEFFKLKESGITEAELDKAKKQMRGNLLLSQENTNNIMFKAGSSLLLRNEIQTVEEISKRISEVEMSDIKRIIDLLINKDKLVISLVGPEEICPDISIY